VLLHPTVTTCLLPDVFVVCAFMLYGIHYRIDGATCTHNIARETTYYCVIHYRIDGITYRHNRKNSTSLGYTSAQTGPHTDTTGRTARHWAVLAHRRDHILHKTGVTVHSSGGSLANEHARNTSVSRSVKECMKLG
jgi:hypothetical protein